MATDKDSPKDEDTKSESDENAIVAGISAPHVVRPDAPFSTQQQIMPSSAPPVQMVKVKEVATGRVFAAWPVDARELVTHPDQGHVYAEAHEEMTPVTAEFGGNPTPVAPLVSTSPVGVDPVAPQTPPREGSPLLRPDPLTATALLDDKSKAELQELAKRVGVDPDQSKKQLVEALQPHASAGTLSLGGPTSLGLPPSTR